MDNVRIIGNRMEIYKGRKISILDLDEIMFIKPTNNYTDICAVRETIKDVRFLKGQYLKLLENTTYPHHLVEAGRSYIINLDYLKATDQKTGKVVLEAKNNCNTLAIGTKNVEKVLAKLYDKRRDDVLRTYTFKQKLDTPIEDLNDTHPSEAGHEYVDLGLPNGTLWAVHNIDENLDNPSYYGWGDLFESDSYDWDHYSFEGKGETLDENNDVARINWGGNWRIPTKEEFLELIEHCKMYWVSKPSGCLIIGSHEKKLFLPTRGYLKRAGEHENSRNLGRYWSSTRCDKQTAWTLRFKESDSEERKVFGFVAKEDCFMGLSIRPVLSAPSHAKRKPLKKMILLEEVPRLKNTESRWWTWDRDNHLDGWEVIQPNLPVNPFDALHKLKELCDIEKPAVVVGISSAVILCKQLEGYKRVCVLPTEKPSISMLRIRKKDPFFARGITKELIEQYKKMEETSRVMRKEEECWVVTDRHKDEVEQEYSGWNYVQLPELKDPERYRVTFLYPLIKKIFS